MNKILNITSISIFPPYNGGSSYVYNALKKLSKKNKVSVVTVHSADNKSKASLKNIRIYDILSKNSFVKFFTPKTLLRLIRIIYKEKPDEIIIDFPWFGIYGIIFQKLFQFPYIIREHNVEFLRWKRIGKWWWPILKQYEKFVYKNAKSVLCISKNDSNLLNTQFGISPSKLIDSPPIIDKSIFYPNTKTGPAIRRKLEIGKEPFILFFGSLDYQPNRDAVEVIHKEIAPRVWNKDPNAKFVIVGRNPPENIRNKNIVFTGAVENIADYINASDVVIVPILTGGGVKMKILESLACGKSVVSTTLGSEGIRKLRNYKIFITDSWLLFSNYILLTIKNKDK